VRYGLMLDTSGPLDTVTANVRKLADAGFASAWVAQVFGYDALTLLAVAGRDVPGIELATGVVPTYPRHPLVLASQALTTQAACGGRLVLGIGLSHRVVIEGMFGYSYERPARHMREYLSVLLPLLRGEQVSFAGETLKTMTLAPLDVKGVAPPPVLLAALAPTMLQLAGSLADGTVTWMTGPATVADHIVPSITKAAEAAGRDRPRVVVGLPVCITNAPDEARDRAGRAFVVYGQLPSYRAMLDREGAGGPQDVAIVGDETEVVGQIGRIADGGATDFMGSLFGTPEERARTSDVLASLSRAATHA
jgi:F420-dependent oxidoreductase-like protein